MSSPNRTASKFFLILRMIFVHLPLAMLCAIAVFKLMMVVGYHWQASHGGLHSRSHRYAYQKLEYLHQDIENYRKQHGAFPETLKAVDTPRFKARCWPDEIDAQGRPLDPWNHPFQYIVKDGIVEMYTFGSDGAPGGIGLDADLDVDAQNDDASHPTLEQFLSSGPYDIDEAQIIRVISMFCGLVAFLVYLQGLRQFVEFGLTTIIAREREASQVRIQTRQKT